MAIKSTDGTNIPPTQDELDPKDVPHAPKAKDYPQGGSDPPPPGDGSQNNKGKVEPTIEEKLKYDRMLTSLYIKPEILRASGILTAKGRKKFAKETRKPDDPPWKKAAFEKAMAKLDLIISGLSVDEVLSGNIPTIIGGQPVVLDEGVPIPKPVKNKSTIPDPPVQPIVINPHRRRARLRLARLYGDGVLPRGAGGGVPAPLRDRSGTVTGNIPV